MVNHESHCVDSAPATAGPVDDGHTPRHRPPNPPPQRRRATPACCSPPAPTRAPTPRCACAFAGWQCDETWKQSTHESDAAKFKQVCCQQGNLNCSKRIPGALKIMQLPTIRAHGVARAVPVGPQDLQLAGWLAASRRVLAQRPCAPAPAACSTLQGRRQARSPGLPAPLHTPTCHGGVGG